MTDVRPLGEAEPRPMADSGSDVAAGVYSQSARISELTAENERLREFVTQIRSSAKRELDDAAERMDWHRRTSRSLDRRLRTNRAATAKLRRRIELLEARVEKLRGERDSARQALKKPQTLIAKIRRRLGRVKRAVVGK